MKLFRNKIVLFMVAVAAFVPAVYGMRRLQMVHLLGQGDVLKRAKYVRSVLMDTEQWMRGTYDWRRGFFRKAPQGGWANWAGRTHQRRNVITGIHSASGVTEGGDRPRFTTVNDLNGDVRRIGDRRFAGKRSRFVIKFPDPLDPELTDVRFMQASCGLSPERWAFQVASTPHCLEGSTWKLDRMLENPKTISTQSQGERSTIPTAGAVIYRKYFWPQDRLNAGNRAFIHLFKEMKVDRRDVVTYAGRDAMPDFHDKRLRACTLGNTSSDDVGVVTHANIAVTSGFLRGDWDAYFGPHGRLGTEYERAFGPGTSNPVYPRITHILCSAYDTKKARDKRTGQIDVGHANFAHMVLRGMYEGAVKAAYVNNIRNVVLTVLGGSSYCSEIEWISDALLRTEGFIHDHHMNVEFVLRPDLPKIHGVRSYQRDCAEIPKIIAMAHRINRIRGVDMREVNRQLQIYLDVLHRNWFSMHFDLTRVSQQDKERMSKAARWLNDHME